MRRGLKPRDPSEITINCPDKAGLGFDIARIVFDNGLFVTKGVLWVTPSGCPSRVRWSLLQQRLEDICPPDLAPCWLPLAAPPVPECERMLLLQIYSSDRTGLLHDVAQKLWKLELVIHKVKVSTTPDGKAIDLFFATDNRTKVPWSNWSKTRAEEVKMELEMFLGDAYTTYCEIIPAGPEHGGLTCSPMPPSPLTKELFGDHDPTTPFELPHYTTHCENDHRTRIGNPPHHRVVVTVDNNTSPVHTLLQISCKSRKDFLYDCLRAVKDFNLKVAHGRIPDVGMEEESEVSLFVQDSQGRKITDAREQKALVQCMEQEVGNPVRIHVGTSGIDTELLVATPIENGGRGRPRVFFDVTQALRILDISIFKADVGRHEYKGKRWEIYRFLLVDREEPSLTITCSRMRNCIVDRVRQGLLG